MFTPRNLWCSRRKTKVRCIYRNQELTTWSLASAVTAKLLYGMIFQRNFALQNPLTFSRDALIKGPLHRTPTRQICKAVYDRKFYMRCIVSIIVTLTLLTWCKWKGTVVFWNKENITFKCLRRRWFANRHTSQVRTESHVINGDVRSECHPSNTLDYNLQWVNGDI